MAGQVCFKNNFRASDQPNDLDNEARWNYWSGKKPSLDNNTLAFLGHFCHKQMQTSEKENRNLISDLINFVVAVE